MGNFVRKLVRFAVRFLAVLLVMIAFSALLIKLPRITVPASRHILVIGDSHTECDIDDTVFERSVNFAKSATAFIYTYAAVKKLVADNPQLDTVLLSVQFTSLNYEREQRWIFNESLLYTRVPVYLPYWDAGDLAVFLKTPAFYKALMQAPLSCADYYYELAKGRGAVWQQGNIGHHLALPYNHLQEDLVSVAPYAELGKKDTISFIQLEYIRKIALFCRARGITLVLINAPVYHPEKYENFRAFETDKKKYLCDLVLLDYSRFSLPDSCYADIYHLNETGARIFSAYLRDHFAGDVAKNVH